MTTKAEAAADGKPARTARKGTGRTGRPRKARAGVPSVFGHGLGENIRRARVAQGLTIVQACALAGGLPAGTWSNYEGGWTIPPLKRYLLVCVALGVHADDLVPGPVGRYLAGHDVHRSHLYQALGGND
jgi:hypothetical protein